MNRTLLKIILIIPVITIILGGCSFREKNKEVLIDPEEQNHAKESQELNQELITEDGKGFVVEKGIINKDWNLLNSYNRNIFHTTDDWSSFEYERDEKVKFSLEYPSNWTFNGYSVFGDENGKIAELTPGGVFLNEGQNCFDFEKGRPNDMVGGFNKLISRENFNFGDNSGVKIIEEVVYGAAGVLHVTTYCIQKNNKAFLMNSLREKAIFEKIISTFKFTE